VVVHHVGFSTGETFRNSVVGPIIGRLDVGVAIFFVLSGYLLFRPFVAGLATGRMPGTWRSYFVKRFARIYPPLVPALIATAAAKNLLDMSPVEWVAHATLLHTFVPDWVFDVMSQAWTLTAELGFYLLLPAFVAALAVRCERQPTRERLKTAGRWSFGLVILSWLFNAAVLNSGWEHRFLGVIWLPGQMDQFAIGMLIAVADVRGQFDPWFKARFRRIASPTFLWWGAAGIAIWVMADVLEFPEALQETSGLNWAGVHALRSLVGLCVVLPVVLGPPAAGPIRAAMSSKLGDWLGNLSYAVYLWHLAILEFVMDQLGYELFQAPFWTVLGAVTGLSIVVAAISWYGLERPILRWVGSDNAAKHHVPFDEDRRWAHDPAGMGGRVLGPEPVEGRVSDIPLEYSAVTVYDRSGAAAVPGAGYEAAGDTGLPSYSGVAFSDGGTDYAVAGGRAVRPNPGKTRARQPGPATGATSSTNGGERGTVRREALSSRAANPEPTRQERRLNQSKSKGRRRR